MVVRPQIPRRDEPLDPPAHPIASPRALLAYVKMALEDLLPLATLPEHHAIRAYGESAIDMIETHCIVYELQDCAANADLDPETQHLIARAATVITRLLKVKGKTHDEED